MCDKVRLSRMVITQAIDPHYYGYRSSHKPCYLYCMLNLLRLIFKVYKDLTHFCVFLLIWTCYMSISKTNMLSKNY